MDIKFRQLVDKADIAVLEGRLAVALEAADEALALEPGNPDALCWKGMAQYFSGSQPEGLDTLRAAVTAYDARIEADESFRDTWKQRRRKLGEVLLDRAGTSLDASLSTARLLIDTLKLEHPRAYKVLGVAEVERGRFDAGVPLLERAVAIDPQYASGFYNLACAYAHLGRKIDMLHALSEAIRLGREAGSHYDNDALRDPDFKAFLGDPDFLGLVARLPADPHLRRVYEALERDDPDRVLHLGRKAMTRAADKLAVLEAMRAAASSIVSDLDEHGEANLFLYEHDDPDHYIRVEADLGRQIDAMRASGVVSDVFKRYKG